MPGVKRKAVAQEPAGRKGSKWKKKSKVINSRPGKSATKHQAVENDDAEDLDESDTTDTVFSKPELFTDDSPAGDLVESDTTETEVFEGFDDERKDDKVDEEAARKRGRDTRQGGVALSTHNTGSKTAMKFEAQNVFLKGTSSKEAHAKQKALTQERKAAKPNAAQIERSKKIWERLRRKSHVPLDERKKLVAELFKILTGHFKDFVFKHDAVRVVQAAVKYGNLEQRKMIAKELKGDFKSLAESRYAKHLVDKLLVHGSVNLLDTSITFACAPADFSAYAFSDEEMRDMIISEFYGSVRRLIRLSESSWVLDDIYRAIATPQQKAILLREWYGPEFALFKPAKDERPTSKLSEILQASPEKRGPIMRYLFELINQLVQKKTTNFTMLHDAMLEYFLNIQTGSEERRDFIDLITGDDDGDLLGNLAFTRTKSGSKVVSLCLASGTAKDRKQILRTYKDVIQRMSYNQHDQPAHHAHTILLTCYEVIDDTVLLSKTIISGLLGKEEGSQEANIVDAVHHLQGRIAYLYLPAGRAKWLLSAEEIAFLQEIDQIRSSTSKKDPVIRRQELLNAISPALLRTIAKCADALCQTSFGCQFITEVLLGCVGDKTHALKAVAEVAAAAAAAAAATEEGPDPSSAEDATQETMMSSIPGGRMLKTLVLGGHFNAKLGRVEVIEPPLNFHEMFYDHVKSELVAWATGPNSFVIVALLETDGFGRKDEVLDTLRRHAGLLDSAAKSGPQGGVILGGGGPSPSGGEMRKKKTKNKKRKKQVENTGNKGAALLLSMLGTVA
ncbi:MAG: pumilio domain member 6 [Peltula sp. TS41687]|nr:MAG: pumilio domain member 6 [Peltula sp. TS41687]